MHVITETEGVGCRVEHSFGKINSEITSEEFSEHFNIETKSNIKAEMCYQCPRSIQI